LNRVAYSSRVIIGLRGGMGMAVPGLESLLRGAAATKQSRTASR
jgi:hypothetical protein